MKNEVIIHHHIGSDGQAVAIPQSLHKGYGEIHIIERELGVTANAKSFSDNCREICEGDTSLIGKTIDDYAPLVSKKTYNTNSLLKYPLKGELTINQFITSKRGGNIMSEGMTIRNPYEMDKFAEEIKNYCQEIRTACNNLKSNLSSAEPGMKDDVSKKALQRVEQLADDLLAGLPTVEETAEMLKKAAIPLKEALSINMR